MVPHLLVDRREPEEIERQLEAYPELFVPVVCELPAGDFAIELKSVSVGIERKTVTDLLGSLADGRFAEQLREMLRLYGLPVLLLEGEWRAEPSGKLAYFDPRSYRQWVATGWNWASVENALLEVQLLGVVIVRHPRLYQTGQAIARIVAFLSKNDHSLMRTSRRTPFVSLQDSYPPAVWALASFRGVGPEMAHALIDRFGSVAGVVEADVEAIAEVKVGKRRIGMARATALHNALRGGKP